MQDKIYEIDEELDKVKEAAIKYAEKEKADVLRGSDYKLKITERQKVSSPSKGSPERQELEKILRDAGKWDEISDLDTHAMEKSINEEHWEKKLISRIKKFLTIDAILGTATITIMLAKTKVDRGIAGKAGKRTKAHR